MKEGIESIQVSSLKKRFGYARALAGVDITLRRGSLCALLGPNGAGKSTLLGILSTLVRPTEGTVKYNLDGKEITPGRELRRHLGVLAHDSFLYGGLNALENLQFWAKLYDLKATVETLRDALIRVGLDEKAWERPASTYSRGMSQRLALARTMLHDPSVLLLDEPFTGLDRMGAKQLTEALEQQKAAGKLLVVVTHDMESIASISDHVVVLNRGKITFDQSKATLSYPQMAEIYREHSVQS